MRELTQRQEQILALIRGSALARGRFPRVRELMEISGIASTNGMLDHLHALERKGKVRHVGREWRLVADPGRCPTCGQAVPE